MQSSKAGECPVEGKQGSQCGQSRVSRGDTWCQKDGVSELGSCRRVLSRCCDVTYNQAAILRTDCRKAGMQARIQLGVCCSDAGKG